MQRSGTPIWNGVGKAMTGADSTHIVRWFSVVVALAAIGTQALDNGTGLAITPPRGWRSWNEFGCDVNHTIIEAHL